MTDDRAGDVRGHTSSGASADAGLAQRLSDLARSLEAEPDLDETLQRIVRAAVDNIPGAAHAGVMLIEKRTITTPAGSSDLVERVDQAQYDTDQGPCLDAIRDDATVRVEDMSAEQRWPQFAQRAAELGVRSMLSFQLFVRDRDLGALNLYAEEPHAFDNEAEQVGLLLASHAAIAMMGAQQQHHMRSALANRDLIGQAKGVLMERYKITADRAFALLVRASQESNAKLHDVARQVTETGQDPVRPARV
ncbi:GAF and ANTAR domain-containing protein [Nakamurella leprariae]|uniref:GAF and ANTAR domain-containing protein n=1 Tax=Nakamurella leprariae TaxID=2803911 RepID=A0A938YGJ9_9ACTN|nr:GAF and ANTAR domain-containing protein [Nakamurella leprariae]MBM9469116.1 GAF and ANTAR domain-containing protein [Nakamurella leprariae]